MKNIFRFSLLAAAALFTDSVKVYRPSNSTRCKGPIDYDEIRRARKKARKNRSRKG